MPLPFPAVPAGTPFFYKDTTKRISFQEKGTGPPKQPWGTQSERKPLPMISLVLVMNIKEWGSISLHFLAQADSLPAAHGGEHHLAVLVGEGALAVHHRGAVV